MMASSGLRISIQNELDTIYSQLELEGLLQTSQFVTPQRLLNVAPRLAQTQSIVREKGNLILTNPEQDGKKYLDIMSGFGMSVDVLIQDWFEGSLRFMNSCFELIKMFLFEILDGAALDNKFHRGIITEKTEYGRMIGMIIDIVVPQSNYLDSQGNWIQNGEQTWKKNKFDARSLWMTDLRNAVAHEDWSYNNRQFSCKLKEYDQNLGDEVEVFKTLNLNQIMTDVESAMILEQEVSNVYFRKFPNRQ